MIRVATIVKDEAGRYFESALAAWQTFADDIIVFDDDSTDNTKQLAESAGADVFNLIDGTDMWGNEAPHRSALFNYAMRKADPDDVIFWLDADMVPAKDPTKFFAIENLNAWSFNLYDLWGQDQDGRTLYRTDDYWRGHYSPRVWALRKPASYDSESIKWDYRGIHSGHIPSMWFNRPDLKVMIMPTGTSLLHYGYYTQQDREDRHTRYLSVRAQLNPAELAHAQTILDISPILSRLPFTPNLTLERA